MKTKLLLVLCAVFLVSALVVCCENPLMKKLTDPLFKDKDKPGPIILTGPVTEASLQAAIDAAPNGATIVLPAGTWSGLTYIEIDKDITIVANGNVTLEFVTSGGVSIWVSGGTLTLGGGTGNIIIAGDNVGQAGNQGVYIANGTVVMKDNVTIMNFKNSAGAGSAVYIDNGTFIMEGGTIEGNESPQGGGVCMSSAVGTIFIMSGGTIRNNTATSQGGGVYMYGGTFTMSGGTIYGNTASTGGASLYVNSGTAQYSDSTIIASPGTGTNAALTGY